jgi:hypothetical protein
MVGNLQADPDRPEIVSIQRDGTDILVTARVPAGIRRATLEGRARSVGAWEPRGVARLDGSGGTTSFRVACSRDVELLRIRGDAQDLLPASFYTGTNVFYGDGASSSGLPGAPLADSRAGPGAAPPSEPSREVVESDIWHIRGQTLYFFNQYRGLQIIDITNPDTAAVKGTLALPASGEDMYLLGSSHVVLLARDGCYYGSGAESQVLVVEDRNGTPAVTASLPVPGYVLESRMVGTALYVASQAYRQVTASNIWEWGTLVSSFDLADPAAPVKRDMTLWQAGYGNVVAATEQYLFVASTHGGSWQQSAVSIIDISQPDGTMRAIGEVVTAGRVPDKFKINYEADREVLTIVSQIWNNGNPITKLETFRLPAPGAMDPPVITKLGELQLGINEQLHATRFDGDRVYVVTFHVQFRLDPLWVVDLSDPAHPSIKGQLEVPGWSTYLHPMGDRLLALGIETNSTTVSLFDVANPEQPALLKRVQVGSGWSWTEANWDEHAFGVFPEARLVLVPFQSWTSTGSVRQVQLVDLLPDSLAVRGVIDHEFQPRRARIHGDRILSISGRELLSVKFSNRDAPVVRGTTELAWPVDRVFLAGDHLIEIANGSDSWGWYWWFVGEMARPVLRVASTGDPDHVLSSLTLSSLPIVGATQQGDYLYLVQAPMGWYYPWYVVALDGSQTDTNVLPGTAVLLSVIDLSSLPQISVLAQVETRVDTPFFGGDLQALWPKPGVLVWSGGGMQWWWWRAMPIAVDMAGPAAGVGMSMSLAPWPWFWPGSGGRLLAYDVTDPAAPTFASKVDLNSSNRWSFSQAFSAEGLVYVGNQTSEFVPDLYSPWWTRSYTNIYVDETTGETNIYVQPAGSWVQRSFVDVIDYADAVHPTVREPVNISGMLEGISHQGALLYATSSEWRSNTNATNGYVSWTSSQRLDALAYDGVSAHLVDSIALPNVWPRPVRVVGNNVFLGRSGYDYSSTNRYPHYVESWTVRDTGKFAQLGQVVLIQPANALHDFPGMLAAQLNNSTIVLIGLADPANLEIIGQDTSTGCLWFDLKHASGNASDGLWVPLGGFGVGHIGVAP